jgi:hypothetical protein
MESKNFERLLAKRLEEVEARRLFMSVYLEKR